MSKTGAGESKKDTTTGSFALPARIAMGDYGPAQHLLNQHAMNTPETYSQSIPVGELDGQTRGRFVSRTYNHLFTSIVAFVLLEVALFKSGLAAPMAKAMLGVSWLLVLGGFVVM